MDQAVRAIIEEVMVRGDEALIDFTLRFDGLALQPETLRISDAEIDAAEAECPKEALEALALAKERIETYHRAQRPQDSMSTDPVGVTLGWRWTAIESVGLYVPGGSGELPLLRPDERDPGEGRRRPRIVMVVPTPKGETNPLVLAAARPCRRRRGLPHRRRPGGRGARLRHRDHRRPSPRSSGPATPVWRPPSAGSSARSAST